MYCENCGFQVTSKDSFCPQCGKKLSAVKSVVQKQAMNYSDVVGDAGMCEKFSPLFGVGKSFTITDTSIIIGNMKYLYSDMEKINLVNPPTSLTNGVAQTRVNGKILTLSFQVSQEQRFMKALEYANEQIDVSHGVDKKYKYMVQDGSKIKVEIYEDYIIYYTLKAGITAIVGNSMAGGSNGTIVDFLDLEVRIIGESNVLRFMVNNIILDIPLSDENIQISEEIVKYVCETKEKIKAEASCTYNEKWELLVGENMEFTINDKVLHISKEMDLFNKYRIKFRTLASECADKAKEEGTKKIQNLQTYLEFLCN